MDVLWNFHEVFPEQVDEAHALLSTIFSAAKTAKARWNERETIRRIIFPVLEKVLSYPSEDISETPDPTVYYEEKRLDADFVVRNDCVIEAKRMKTPLLAWSKESAGFSNAIDQGLTYLDNYNSNFCIITNGWDWYLFAKSTNWNIFNQVSDINYFGIRFRLDDAASSPDKTRLFQFMSLFNNASISNMVNRRIIIKGCTERILARNMYGRTCKLFFRDFSTSPTQGPGSGFNWPTSR